MRKRQTFLLTIVAEENAQGHFCGRVKAISTGKTCNFTNLNEMNALIASEMSSDHSPTGHQPETKEYAAVPAPPAPIT